MLVNNDNNSSNFLPLIHNPSDNSVNISVSMPSTSQILSLSPADIRPFPKAEPRNPLKKK